MKKIIALAFAATLMSTAAHADDPSVPAYMKDKGTWVLSAIFLPPVIALNVLGEIGDKPRDGQDLKSLRTTTVAMAKQVKDGVCDLDPSEKICQ